MSFDTSHDAAAAEGLSDAELDEIERCCDAATDGPWDAVSPSEAEQARGWWVDSSQDAIFLQDYFDATPTDAAFIAASRTDVPKLIAEVRRLRQVIASAIEDYDRRDEISMIDTLRRALQGEAGA
jgi:hypothetical protein